MTVRSKVLAALAIVALLDGCTTAMTPNTRLPSLDGTAWVLSNLTGHTVVAGAKPTLQFAGDRVTGSDGCNRFSGRYTVTRQAFKVIPPLAATQKACGPEIDAQARGFTEALGVAGSYRIRDGQLELLAASGAALATLVEQSATLADTAWRASGINNGKGGVVSLVPGTEVTLQFAADGQASGSAGCNRWTSTYQFDGKHLTFGAASLTRKACAEAAVLAQEQAFLRALGDVSSARVEGDRLELRRADGAVAIAGYREGSD
jgi:heat shock protein HslJ